MFLPIKAKPVFAIICLIVGLAYSGLSIANPELLRAADAGELEAVQVELASGANVNYTAKNKAPKYGYLVHTALEKASAKGYTEMVALLLESGAQVRTDKWYGLYAATWAGQAGHTEIVALLLDNTRPAPEQLNFMFGPALISSTGNGRLTTVSLLLEQGVSPNWHTPKDNFPRPAILQAARSGQAEIFSVLLNAGADPTPYPEILTLTAMGGDVAMTERLLSMGMDPNVANDVGQPLSMVACSYEGSDPVYLTRIAATAELLLEAGSEVNVPARGRSALFCAEEDGNEVLVNLLQARDAKSFETLGRKSRRLGLGVLFTLGDH
jgi:ankyrin repeat protein